MRSQNSFEHREPLPETAAQEKVWERRQLLKIMTAASGALVGSIVLPERWTAPIIETGLLPVHAQASPATQIQPPPDELPPLACIDVGFPSDVILTLDRSGSVSLSDLANAKNALKEFVKGRDLSVERLGVVSFASEATLKQALSQNSNDINNAIDDIGSGGSTDIAGAIRLSEEELTTNSNATNKVIILISDGGQSVPGDPIADAQTAKDNGIRILSVGLGFFFDVNIMRAIASRIEDFYFTPESADLVTIFDPQCEL